jgi:hypothetical protein
MFEPLPGFGINVAGQSSLSQPLCLLIVAADVKSISQYSHKLHIFFDSFSTQVIGSVTSIY